jgi:hypothetical protein
MDHGNVAWMNGCAPVVFPTHSLRINVHECGRGYPLVGEYVNGNVPLMSGGGNEAQSERPNGMQGVSVSVSDPHNGLRNLEWMHVHDANASVNDLVLEEVVVLNGSGNAMLLQGAESRYVNGNGNVGVVVCVNESDRRYVHAMYVNYVSGHANANVHPVK